MGYSGSVSCRCVARGLVTIPAALAEVVRVTERGDVRGPDRRSPHWPAFEAWQGSACDHPGFEAADFSLGNNRMVGILERAVEWVCGGDPAIAALLDALPRHHGSTTPPERSRAALPGVALARAQISGITISGLDTEDGMLFWDLGTTMRIWLSGSGVQSLSATVDDGVIGIQINDEVRITGCTLDITPLSDDGDVARFTDPETGATALARWPYRCRVLRGYTGPMPADTHLLKMLAAVEALIEASVAQDMPIWWG